MQSLARTRGCVRPYTDQVAVLNRSHRKHSSCTHLVDLDARVFADNTRSAAGRIEQDSIESSHHFGELATVVATDDDVPVFRQGEGFFSTLSHAHTRNSSCAPASQAGNISSETLGTGLVGIVGKDHACVLLQG
jgi:hypothetical protein